MDRTDIIVGTQSKVGSQVSVETLQPLTHYDENSKSSSIRYKVASVKADKRIKLGYFSGGNGDIGIHTIQLLKKANNGIDRKNITILNHWELLLMSD